ncbi:hypothetical protein ANCCAN_12662 [Ancylostoma caninum]|uniref:Uncharacterized protein n=1 Tax=Ancylostoma caninum TaxID=29170 RepID=A0A368GED7_ANCCA|nr:hypothetical protein ANCCAN_12662 [Ancylostoma caninum]
MARNAVMTTQCFNNPRFSAISRRLIKYGPVSRATTPPSPPSTTLPATLSSLGPEESYEEIEYVEDEEETEEREESVNRLLPTFKVFLNNCSRDKFCRSSNGSVMCLDSKYIYIICKGTHVNILLIYFKKEKLLLAYIWSC